MARILVGDPDCTFQEIALIFEEQSISMLKITWWTSLATILEIPLDSMETLRRDILLDKRKHIEVILTILTQWRLIKSDEATLGALHATIPDDQKQLKNYLQAKIRQKAKFWDDLDRDSQNLVLQTNVSFLGRTYLLSSIRAMMSKSKFDEIVNTTDMQDLFQKSFNEEVWDLGHYQIPESIPYYIQRRLTQKRKLNSAIFKHTCEDIFLIEGIQHHHLSILAKPELTDVSSDQLKKVTRRFILLEHPDDYNEIIKIATYPVHRIEYKDNQFYWLSSSGSFQIIRVFLTSESEEFDETCFIEDQLSTFNNRPIAICSSPGMGKSVLLSKLAQQMIKSYPKRIIIYLQLSSLASKLSSIGSVISSELIFHILTSCSSFNSLGNKILLELLCNTQMTFEIFLDGFDEISSEYLDQAKNFLISLLKLSNMRVYITSRPHMQLEIEKTLEVISLDIAPFSEENQVNFLCDFWCLSHNIENHEKLVQFALKVLDPLELKNPTKISQTKFAGIPLQCWMLAQVYGNQAKMYCDRNHFIFQATNSLYQLYSEFVTLKFQKIDECDKRLLKFYHWMEALMLLFPDNQQANQIISWLKNYVEAEKVPLEKIFTVGILEHVNNEVNFVHKTFAEYLLAEFIVEELLINEVVNIDFAVKFIIESALFVHVSINGQILEQNELIRVGKYIESSETFLNGKLNAKLLKDVLISQDNVRFEFLGDNLFEVLYFWRLEMGPKASIEELDRALEFLNCRKLVDDLHENIYEQLYVFKHEMVCTLMDSALEKYGEKLWRCGSDSQWISNFWNELRKKLLLCTQNGYQFLTKVLVEFYRCASFFEDVRCKEFKVCEQLVFLACFNDNVEFFKNVCDTAKLLEGFSLSAFINSYALTDKNLNMQITPVLEIISRGNYKLVEYLINNAEEDINRMSHLWLICFLPRYLDSPNLIGNKLKILKLLKSCNQEFQIEKLERNFPSGINLLLLTSLFDLYDYTPSEKDVVFLRKSIWNCCNSDTEMENLVELLISKNCAHLLTHMLDFDRCLIGQAILANLTKPETLKTVYSVNTFDLGIIFSFAVQCKRSETLIKTIIELSGDVNFKDKGHNTLLHWATLYRNFNAIRYLMSIGADVNCRNGFQNTPLYNVFQQVDFLGSVHTIHDIVYLFVSNKAVTSAKNIAGISVVEIAKANKDELGVEEKTFELLENEVNQKIVKSGKMFNCSAEFYKNFNCQLFDFMCRDAVCFNLFFEFVKNMVQCYGNVNICNSHGTTLLHKAALYGEKEALSFLLTKGADVNLVDNDGDTPIHYILDWRARSEHKVLISLNKKTEWIHDCVELLLKHKADINIKNKKGETAFDLFQQRQDTLKIESRTIELLIKKQQHKNKVGNWKLLLQRLSK